MEMWLKALLAASLLATVTPAAAAPKAETYYSKTYSACMDAAGGSTYPTRDCISAEHDDWDKALNQVYQAVMASRSAAEKIQLRNDERAWLKRSTAKCDHAGDDEAGGSLQSVEIDQCYLDQTILRTVHLRGLH